MSVALNDEKYFLRDIIGNYMYDLGVKNDKVMLVNADLMGTCRNRKFAEEFPDRAFNVGIAEQNMVSFAAGLAHEGYIPYAFSMAPFLTMRACEQCRTDVAYANLNVRMMGTYAGLSGGISGATHWSIEDVAIMAAMPNVTVVEVSEPNQAVQIMDQSLDFKGPMYIRSSVEPVFKLYDDDYKHKIGKASIVKEGSDGAIICSGVVVKYALEAANALKADYGKDIRVVDMHTIKPVDREAVVSAAQTGNLIVAQDHNIYGGLGSIVATVLAEEGCVTKFKNIGISDVFVAMAHAPYLYGKFGYDAKGLYNSMKDMLGVK